MGQLLSRSARIVATVVSALAAGGLHAPAAQALSVPTSPAATTVTLVVGTVSGPAFQRVPLTATVAGVDPGAAPTGSCTFRDGAVVLAQVVVGTDGSCEYTSTGFAPGEHIIAVEFVPDGEFAGSTSAPVAASYLEYDCLSGDSCEDPETVLPPIPRGELVISTPYTPANPFDLGELLLDPGATSYTASAPFGTVEDPAAGVTIVDTRTGRMPFTAQIASTDFVDGGNAIPGSLLGFTGITPVYIPGNAITPEADAVSVSDVPSLAPAGTMFATGTGPGSVFVIGRMSLTRVPTSTPQGVYLATVTFTLS